MKNKYLNNFLYMRNDWKEYILHDFAHRVTTHERHQMDQQFDQGNETMSYGFRNFVDIKQRIMISFT